VIAPRPSGSPRLDDYGASKERLREIEAVEEEVSRQPAAKPSPKGGRPRGGNHEVARRTGLDEREIRRTRKHVAAGERYPALQGPGWRRGAALDAADARIWCANGVPTMRIG